MMASYNLNLVSRILKWLLVGLVGVFALTLIAGLLYQNIRESRDLERYPPPGRMVGVDGHLVHIHCIGKGSPTVILELGVGSASFAWYDIHKRISQITRTCAYDRAGLGYSEPTEEAKRAINVAATLHALLANAGIDDELVLVGWSAGGIYIREYYRRFPERVVGMLLVDSSHEQQVRRLPRGSGGGADPALAVAKHLAPFGLIRLSGLLDKRVASSRASDEAKAYLRVTYNLSHALDTVARESDAFNHDIDSDEAPAPLGNLPLIVVAAGDPQLAAMMPLQKELAALSTQGKLIVAEDSDHNIHADQPQLIVDAVKELANFKPSSDDSRH
jgi:pimeloyl-ACP methyl ester carboxylesterase